MSTCTETLPIPDRAFISDRFASIWLKRKSLEPEHYEDESLAIKYDEVNDNRCHVKWPSVNKTPELSTQLWLSRFLLSGEKDVLQNLIKIYSCLLLNDYREDSLNSTVFPADWAEELLKAQALSLIPTLDDYLHRLVGSEGVSESIAEKGLKIWKRLQSEIGKSLPEPDAAPSSNNTLMLAWDKGQLHIEFEITAPDRVEVFLLNRNSNEIWETEFHADDPFPSALIAKLAPLVE